MVLNIIFYISGAFECPLNKPGPFVWIGPPVHDVPNINSVDIEGRKIKINLF